MVDMAIPTGEEVRFEVPSAVADMSNSSSFVLLFLYPCLATRHNHVPNFSFGILEDAFHEGYLGLGAV